MSAQLAADTLSSFGLPDFVVGFFASHPYGIIFCSLIVGGGIILFPAFYLAIKGYLNAEAILIVMMLADIVADSFWYLVGRGLLPSFIEKRIEKGRYIKKITEVTEGKELTYLFYSKFVYGTRIAFQLLCGTRMVNYFAFIMVNTVAVLLLGSLYYGVIRITSAQVDSLGDLKYKIGLVLLVTVAIVGTLHFLVYRMFKKRLLRD